jgi:hypothetical protein
MFLGILLDCKFDSEEERISIAWNVYHDLFLGEESLATIECRSSVLLSLSESMETWSTSEFGQRFRIVNIESLQACREIWKKYQSYARSPTTYGHLLTEVLETTSAYEIHWCRPDVCFPPLPASFGIRSIKSAKVVQNHTQQY